jgi:hypothetical protein
MTLVAAAAGLRDQSERPVLDALAIHLRERRVLLMRWSCFVRGHWSEARAALEAALARAQGAPHPLVPKALHAATFFALRQGDLARASALGEQGLALCRELGDSEHAVWLLTWVGLVALRRGQRAEAEGRFEGAIALARAPQSVLLLNLVQAQAGVDAGAPGHDVSRGARRAGVRRGLT